MNEMLLLKLGELVLKGLNRRSFEDKLQANIHRRLNNLGQFKVYTRQSTTYVEPMNENCDMDGAYEAMKTVFGVVGLSRARACEKDKDAILAACKEYLDDQLSTARTFKVETKRADKTFPMTSIQLSQYVGGELHEHYDNLSRKLATGLFGNISACYTIKNQEEYEASKEYFELVIFDSFIPE